MEKLDCKAEGSKRRRVTNAIYHSIGTLCLVGCIYSLVKGLTSYDSIVKKELVIEEQAGRIIEGISTCIKQAVGDDTAFTNDYAIDSYTYEEGKRKGYVSAHKGEECYLLTIQFNGEGDLEETLKSFDPNSGIHLSRTVVLNSIANRSLYSGNLLNKDTVKGISYSYEDNPNLGLVSGICRDAKSRSFTSFVDAPITNFSSDDVSKRYENCISNCVVFYEELLYQTFSLIYKC